jgi:hypothetical protein
LEDGTLCEAELRGEILDARSVVTLLGEVPERGVDNSSAFGFEARARLRAESHGRFEKRPA